MKCFGWASNTELPDEGACCADEGAGTVTADGWMGGGARRVFASGPCLCLCA